jgi:hypothetical protein
LAGYDFRLAASPAFSVRGSVLDETGAPVPHARVALKAEGSVGNEAIVSAGKDGRFAFPAVVPGWWRVTAEAGAVADESGSAVVLVGGGVTQRGFAAVEVRRQDVDGLGIHVFPPFAIDVSMEREDQGSALPGSLFLTTLDLPGEMVGATRRGPGDAPRFERVFPGTYQVLADAAEPGTYLASATLGGRDILGQAVVLAPGSPAIHAVFGARPGGVAGFVEKGPSVTVVLLPQNGSRRDLDSVAQAQCQADGRFAIGSLPPDEYYAWAFERLDVEALRDPAFVGTLVARAATVHVNRGETASINLSITPWPE